MLTMLTPHFAPFDNWFLHKENKKQKQKIVAIIFHITGLFYWTNLEAHKTDWGEYFLKGQTMNKKGFFVFLTFLCYFATEDPASSQNEERFPASSKFVKSCNEIKDGDT